MTPGVPGRSESRPPGASGVMSGARPRGKALAAPPRPPMRLSVETDLSAARRHSQRESDLFGAGAIADDADRASSVGIFEFDADTPTSGSENDEPSTPLQGVPRRRGASRGLPIPRGGRVRHASGRAGDATAWMHASPPWGGSGPRSFRTTPSFSSPLALAPTLPDDVDEHHAAPRPKQRHAPRRITPPNTTMGPPPVPQYVRDGAGTAPNTPARTLSPHGFHRRAHSSSGASTEGLCRSPIGGPDGVDPGLIAAINVRDAHARRSVSALPTAAIALGSSWSGTPTTPLSPPEQLPLESPLGSPAVRSDTIRLQRVPRNVALANDLVVPPARSRDAQMHSPQPSPTSEDASFSRPTVLGLGLGLPSPDVRRAYSTDGRDMRPVVPEQRADAEVLAVTRAVKARRWRSGDAMAWRDVFDESWRRGLVPRTPVEVQAHKYWDGVRAEIPRLDPGAPSYARLADGVRVTTSLPSLHALRVLSASPAPVEAPPSDVFGPQRAQPPHGTRIVSAQVQPVSAPARRRPTRSTNASIDDTVAAQRRQLWEEVVRAKSACDAELDKTINGLVVLSEAALAGDVRAEDGDTTVVDTGEYSTSVEDALAAEMPRSEPSPATAEQLTPLQSLAVIATELRARTLHMLLEQPSVCSEYICRVQVLGAAWDVHPEWLGRGWYVELLLTIAGLSRVLEWWDAEHRFWSMETDRDAPSRLTRECSTDISPASTMEMAASSASGPRAGVSASGSHVSADAPGPGRGSGTSSSVDHAMPAAPMPLSNSPPAADTLPNVLMEVSLEGRVQYLSPAWARVVGTDPASLTDASVGTLFAGGAAGLFHRATRQLQESSWHTVEMSLQASTKPVWMHAQGMLVHYHGTRTPSHTMWVLNVLPEGAVPAPDLREGGAIDADAAAISTELLLCRICERDIPAWFFDKHSEICHEIHRLEMEIGTCNETLLELLESTSVLATALEAASAAAKGVGDVADTEALAYRGQPLELPPPSSAPASALEGAVRAVPLERTSRAHALKYMLHIVDEVRGALEIAMNVSTPTVADDAEAVEFDRLLSPTSAANAEALRAWDVHAGDPALALLAADAKGAILGKVHAVNRMRNTMVYVETVRMESEAYVGAALGDGADSEIPPPPSTEGDAAVVPEQAEPPVLSTSPGALAVPSAQSPVQSVGSAQKHTSSVTPPVVIEEPAPDALENVNHLLLDPVDEPELSDEEWTVNSRSPIAIPPRDAVSTPPPEAFAAAGTAPLAVPVSQGTSLSDTGPLGRSLGRSPRLGTTPSLSGIVPPAQPRATVASIKDFELLKPISKGAYGSVFLARKRATGDLYAIKVLKKSDMIAKNQITNVRAERMILMNRTQSPFVVKLFFTFQSAEYLYLVMEYLPGGDCASLVKVFGALPEDWTRQYLAEIVQGLDYLHSTGVVHRDMKPDNLLIDQRGHLKLTDFGLSKFGLLGRHTHHSDLPRMRSTWVQVGAGPSGPSPVPNVDASPGSSVDASAGLLSPNASPSSSTDRRSTQTEAYFRSLSGPQHKRVVGTPDYLAPESILGVGMDDFGVDWWAVGAILFEFTHGYPPFHADTPAAVFDRILSRQIAWDNEIPVDAAARDLIERLLCSDRAKRLGAHGVEEIKAHPYFAGMDWEHLTDGDGPFVPQLSDAASTDYFDARGAVPQLFDDSTVTSAPIPPQHMRMLSRSSSSPNEFGSFSYKNLPVLKQANDEMVRRIRTEHSMAPASPASVSSGGSLAAPQGPPPPVPPPPVPPPVPPPAPSMPASPSLSPQSPRLLRHSRAELERQRAASDPPHILLADYNPVSRGILLTSLTMAGARVTVTSGGAETLSTAMGDESFDAILLKLALSVVNGQDIARMVKSTRNVNMHTPVVALVVAGDRHLDVTGSVFDDVLPVPAQPSAITTMLTCVIHDRHEDVATAQVAHMLNAMQV